MEQEVCARWLAFSCFCPIMEVGPTRDKGFWNVPRGAHIEYDADLIAIWRVYARLHHRLMDYSYKHGQIAHNTGMPIVRPLFLVEPQSPQAWSNWWTYQYGEDILVSPIWKKNKREQDVYLPAGHQWQDAWHGTVYDGGQTITVKAELHQIPLFVRIGANLDLGDLNLEYQEARAIADTRPDLKTLEAEVKAWFTENSESFSVK
jgi:alpha-glucosidase (family GH31 glycosyl hydrolase)